MANEKRLDTRIINKHDSENNWLKAGEAGFIPKKGEWILYDPDDNYGYFRVKIGDGVTKVHELAFSKVSWEDVIDHPNLYGTDSVAMAGNIADSVGGAAFGNANQLVGDYDFAAGLGNQVQGDFAQAFGVGNIVYGDGAHAEGGIGLNIITGSFYTPNEKIPYNATEEQEVQGEAIGSYSHKEGAGVIAKGYASHAEGGVNNHQLLPFQYLGNEDETFNWAQVDTSDIQQVGIAEGDYSHIEGLNTYSIAPAAHAEGQQSVAGAKGYFYNAIYPDAANNTTTFVLCETQPQNASEVTLLSSLDAVDGTGRPCCEYDPSNGRLAYANDDKQYNFEFTIDRARPYLVTIKGKVLTQVVNVTSLDSDDYSIHCPEQPMVGDAIIKFASHAEGWGSEATGTAAHAEGAYSYAYGDYSHAEGWGATTYHHGAHAEGRGSKAYGNSSHTEGNSTEAYHHYGHAEGDQTISKGNASHAEGVKTRTNGSGAHAEGGAESNSATTFSWTDDVSHEGYVKDDSSETVNANDGNKRDHVRPLKGASGNYVHTEGYNTTAMSTSAHAEGQGAIARGVASHAEGQYTQANGTASHAEGYNTLANADYAHAEGKGTKALAKLSHAEGEGSIAYSYFTHAEGNKTIAGNAEKEADGRHAHAEGMKTQATRTAAHAEGGETQAIAEYAHAEGRFTLAQGKGAHAEGARTNGTKTQISWTDDISFGDQKNSDSSEAVNANDEKKTDHVRPLVGAKGLYSHTEGLDTSAVGENSHAEGQGSIARGKSAHVEGQYTQADGATSHAEGNNAYAKGYVSHAEGKGTLASGNYSHAEGEGTKATAHYTHAEGGKTTASGSAAHAEGFNTTASGVRAHAEGEGTTASKDSAHAEGYKTTASGKYSHVEGVEASASGEGAHAEGNGTIASGNASHAEGCKTQATGLGAHAEGAEMIVYATRIVEDEIYGTTEYVKYEIDRLENIASGQGSHVEGIGNIAAGIASHAEGGSDSLSTGVNGTSPGETPYGAFGDYSHAEGWKTSSNGVAAHSEGHETTADGDYSHAAGIGTKATAEAQTVIGKYNAENNDALFIIGDGSRRTGKNLFEVGANKTVGRFITLGTTQVNEESFGQLNTLADTYVTESGVIYRPVLTSCPLNSSPTNLIYGNGRFVGHYMQDIIISEDGVNWIKSEIPDYNYFGSLIYAENRFVAVGYYPNPMMMEQNCIYYSNDGLIWERGADLPLHSSWDVWDQITYGNGCFIVYDSSSILDFFLYSNDGITWTKVTLPLKAKYSTIKYGCGKFVAISKSESKVIYSNDGITWTESSENSINLNSSLVYGNNRFIACPYNLAEASYSDDGINWTKFNLPVSSAESYWKSIHYDNGRFIMLSYPKTDCYIAYSDDGLSWEKVAVPDALYFGSSVSYGNGRFIIFTDGGVKQAQVYVYSDDNGVTWSNAIGAILEQDSTDVTESVAKVISNYLEIPDSIGQEGAGTNAVLLNKAGTAAGKYAVATGYNTEASGNYSFAGGQNTKVLSGNTNAFAYGIGCIVNNAEHSVAMGRDCITGNTAKANYSVAMGEGCTTNAYHSAAIGKKLQTNRAGQMAVGMFNDADKNALFIVGNGSAEDVFAEDGVTIATKNRSNAFTVDNNGNGKFAGSLTLGDVTITQTQLQQLLRLLKTLESTNVAVL